MTASLFVQMSKYVRANPVPHVAPFFESVVLNSSRILLAAGGCVELLRTSLSLFCTEIMFQMPWSVSTVELHHIYIWPKCTLRLTARHSNFLSQQRGHEHLHSILGLKITHTKAYIPSETSNLWARLTSQT